ncbi:MAG: 50S ribosomal protein L11 methyltransferase [bacterium]
MNEKINNTSESEIFEIKIDIPNDQLDILGDFISENICSGFIEEEKLDAPITTLTFYLLPDEVDNKIELLKKYLAELAKREKITLQEISIGKINKVAYEDEYKKNAQPVIIDDLIIVRPPWINNINDYKYDIVIEPKMAFGTGKHETTRSCLKIMLDNLKCGDRFLDMGCGSGILSIMADKMGASYIKAIDYDVVAIENCKENLEFNKATAPYEVIFGSIEKCINDKLYNYICANIIKSTILEMIDQLVDITAENGTLILSGLLAPDLDEIKDALKRNNISNINIHPDNEWRTLIIKKV